MSEGVGSGVGEGGGESWKEKARGPPSPSAFNHHALDAQNNNQSLHSAPHSDPDSTNKPANGSIGNILDPTPHPLLSAALTAAGTGSEPGPENPSGQHNGEEDNQRPVSPASSTPPHSGSDGEMGGSDGTDQESHSSSLESLPSVCDGRELGLEEGEECAEEELGSSTSCSLDSFEISSPFGTLESRKAKEEDSIDLIGTILGGGVEGSGGAEAEDETPVKEQIDSLLGMGAEEADLDEPPSNEDLILSATSFELPIFRVEGQWVGSEEVEGEAGEEGKEKKGGEEGASGDPSTFQSQSLPFRHPTDERPECSTKIKEDEEKSEVRVEEEVTQPNPCPIPSMSNAESRASTVRQSIHDELSKLDTALPHLDFDKLEAQLACAAEEREMKNRKLMSEEVRRRLAMDTDDAPYPPIPSTRPSKSNLGTRLRSGLNMQICYMNDTTLASDEEGDIGGGESSSSDEEFSSVPKSKSTPNLSRKKKQANGAQGHNMGRSASSVCDSSKKASDLRKAVEQIEASEINDIEKKQARLENEARVMLEKAKQAAHMQMEVERQAKSAKSPLEDIIGVELNRCKRMTRSQLSRMNTTQLQIILNDLLNKVEKQNGELVQLLIDKDNLHMEQDSMLVDVEDLLQHQRDAASSLPGFLVNAPPESKFSRFRMFKK